MSEIKENSFDYAAYMRGLVARSRAAQKIAEGYDQKRVDELCEAVSFAACNEEFRAKAAQMLVDEGKMGDYTSKFNKIKNKAMGVYRDMKGEKSVGIIETDTEKNLVTYIKPMGVIGAITPSTNGEATPIVKALWALKARDSLIISPARVAKNTAWYVTCYIRKVLKEMGAPEDLIICIDPEYVGRESSAEMMKQVDFIVATGGNKLVRSAYSSGTPAIGVGAGNDITYIDDTADLADAAKKIHISQVFDCSLSCSSENNVIANEKIYDDFIKACEAEHCYIARNGSEEKAALTRTIWNKWPESTDRNRAVVGQSVQKIAEIAGIKIPEDAEWILIEELDGYGKGFVTTSEKLCPVASLMPAKDFETALDMMEVILDFQGNGHALGIHTTDYDKLDVMGRRMHVARILCNQSQSLGNAGAWFNGMPITMSLGCSTWGGNSTSRNVTWRDVTNLTIVSRPVEAIIPTEEELYSAECRAHAFAPDPVE